MLDAGSHRRAGVEANNGVYDLLDKPSRTADEDLQIVHMAHAAAFHWNLAEGRTIANLARAEYLCSHVYALLGRGEPALFHAQRCLDRCDEGGLDDFDRAFGLAARARAQAALGNLDQAARDLSSSRAVPIADPEDAAIYTSEVAGGPWYGLAE